MMGAADDQEASGGEEKIYVSVRLRPLNGKEIARNDVSDWECINDTTIIYRNNLSVSERSMYPSAYTFDTVFGPERSTRQVYEEGAKNVALSVVSGINSSVFAYGQTSSGKTYTMSGITEYTVADIYDYIERHMEREFVLKFSAMEIYNESVRDLLSADATPLRLLDDPERGTVVERLTEETLRDWNHFKELLCICEAQRQIGETNLNETSSRSHQILRLTIESSAREFLGNDKSSTLAATVNFVDLAGSERASQSLSAGMRLKEGCHINRSLLTLGTVIRKLSKGRNGHIPFRDSKLTRILQSSLGGNARTAIICTMSPARIHVEQSRNTLLFASCAKEVTTNAQVNVVMSDKALVKQLQRELARLESELKSGGHHSVTTDTSLLKEKDLQIEKLMKEVVELNRRLDLAQSRVADLLRAAEDDSPSTVWEDADGQYPKLRVRNSCRSELSASYSSISEGPPSIDVGARSFDDSQCSDRRSSSSSDDKFVQLDLNEFFQTNFSPEPSIRTDDPGEKIAKVQANGDLDSIYEEVLCIKVKSSTHRYADSRVSQTSQNRHSNMSSPNQKTGTSGLTEVRNEEKGNQELASPLLNERKDSNDPNAFFIVPSPEKTSPWVLEQGICSSGSLKLIRSRSCKARLMSNSPGYWFEKVEKKESTPLVGFEKDTPFFRFEKTTSPTGFKKDFIGRPEDCQRKPSCLKYGPEVETLSRNGSRTSVTSSAVDDLKGKGVDSFTDWKVADVISSEAGTMYLGDKSVDGQSSRSTSPEKSVKDVGLDPIQDDAENAPQWPSEFKRLQMQIIELWHACNVSLVHRTYFFLLFKGDPSDSFYMDVELRKLSFLKDTFSRDKATMADGRILTLSSSERALSQERQMLSKEMQRRLSREERENLFLRWGIPLNSNNRRLQLAHRLWTKTADLDHLAESAALVAKLVGFTEEGVALKETFGLLNLTPIYPSRRRISLWKRSVFSLL